MNIASRRRRVGRESVGENRGTGFNMSHKKGAQSVGLSAGNDLNAATTEAFWLEQQQWTPGRYGDITQAMLCVAGWFIPWCVRDFGKD